uniref:THAP domain-containing protein 1 n=1 Tax=Oryzias melastigma TaxID=30732 RepID=A0A3B3BY40_ORYME
IVFNNSIVDLSTISFHSFPVDASVRAEWMVRVRREDFTPSKTSRVCSRHFQKGDFVNNPGKLRKLKKGAIPTLFSWNDFQIPSSDCRALYLSCPLTWL